MKMMPLSALTGVLFLFFSATLLADSSSLAEVGDLGKIVDSQGIVSVRPKMASRWSSAAKDFALKPGDWLRTDVRGANALAIRLQGGGQVILGPGTLVEVIDAKTIAFTRGEIEIESLKKGEGISVQAVEGKEYHVRAGERKVMRRPDGRGVELLEKDPNWLLGFKGAITSESMGSLLAKVDGRNTPLTLGYHKVTVDIRDGIARTVIEESFVNHTNSRLEGTFYFPLPQDASISGFGMWIGGELVEADVVEKQRAREIYETILRERRDPGLLEWTGGNLFKARVFPIEAHSEKRIKITYTQVLPMRGGKLRYSYGLQSEMLQQNPLRELSINVRVSSALPIRSFTCATHDARISSTAHAAQAEFVAQEYTPNRDFEIELDVDAAASPVVMIPHLRGEDGYFLALITPPGSDGDWEREIVPEGHPIHLVILADTSGSMNASARDSQDALIAGLLGSLGEEDSFDLATCDTEVRWFDGEQSDDARDFLAARNSLGWTDLDLVFEEALKHTEHANTHVVYIGDGVITTGKADPVAFANRLKRLYDERNTSATFHAIAPGSSYESGVLKAIASLGGGSVRKIAGSDTPAVVARNLLTGIAQPGMSDMRIEFKGLSVARVYPEDLTNLPLGSQQVVIGRYLPEGTDQRGEIIVTGMQNGKEQRFSAPVTLKDAEKGNSFIPRLWARMYLDVLLEQGRAQEIKDEIIGLSEEYKIMTPYTSFLVLESDADRERFKVKKRFQMRDGERFFADGREQANYELLQQQMRLAGTWRLNLQRGVLRELERLGRIPMAQVMPLREQMLDRLAGGNKIGSRAEFNGFINYGNSISEGASSAFSVNGTVSSNYAFRSKDKLSEDDSLRLGLEDFDESLEKKLGDRQRGWPDLAGEDMRFNYEEESLDMVFSERLVAKPSVMNSPMASDAFAAAESMPVTARERGKSGGFAYGQVGGKGKYKGDYRSSGGRSRVWYWGDYMGDLVSLFPGPIAGGRQVPNREGKPHPWPAEALKLTDSLLRFEQIAALQNGGIAISQKVESFDVIRGTLVSQASVEALLSGKAWWVSSQGDRQGGDVQWWQHKGTRGHYFDALGLGRQREADLKLDRFAFPLALSDQSFTSLADQMRNLNAAIAEREDGHVVLILTEPNNPKNSYRYLIDNARNVLLKITYLYDGKVTGTVEFADFIEKAGCWWARSVEHKNADGKVSVQIKRSFEARDKKAFRAAMKKALLPCGSILFIHEDLPTVDDAKQAALDDKANFESEFTMCNHFANSQQWERSSEHFEAMRKLAGNKRGMRYLDIRFHSMKRRNEEARELAFETARELAPQSVVHELFLVGYLNTESQRVTNPNERFDFLGIVKPVYQRAAEHLFAMKEWQQQMVYALQNTNRRPEAHVLLQKLADEFPRDVNLQTQYANSLANQGDAEEAVAWLSKCLANRGDWQPGDIHSLRWTLINLLENQSQVDEVLKTVIEWLEEDGIDEPVSNWVRRRYLSALIRTGEDDKAYDLMEKWISDAAMSKSETFDIAAQNRAWAAVETLCGSAYRVNRNDIPERFLQPLANLVKRFALDAENYRFAQRPMQDHRFVGTETARKLRAHFTKVMAKRAAKLQVAELYRLYSWISRNDPAVDQEIWESIAETLIKRWSSKKQRAERDSFSSLIVNLTSAQLGADSWLAFLRRQLKESKEEDHGHYANQLFAAILSQPHTDALEEEAFALLYQIDPVQNVAPERREETLVAERAGALIRLDDWVLQSRYQVAWQKLENKEDLSRTELAAKHKKLVKSIREKLSARLANELQATRGEKLADWLMIEQLFVDVSLGRNPKTIAAECWKFLNSKDLYGSKDEDGLSWHEVVLIERYITTLEFLASQPKADTALAKRLLMWLDRGIKKAQDPEPWKSHTYRLLVALDQPRALKKALMSWIKPDDANNEWRVTLGYLQAELNEIADAVSIFEAVEKADELGPLEYKTLADWYLVLDQKQARDRAILAYYQAMDEWQLSNLIQQQTSRIENGFNNGTPEDFDPVVVDMFKAIFKKSQSPQNHLHHLGSLFRYTKDFRLLECVPEGILGNSAQQIYPFLGQMDQVLQYVTNEATTDQLLAHLAAVSKRAETSIDQRGLDLLEMLTRRKASEVLNQPGQHVPQALTAMQRAFKLDWGSGERRLMADFLANLGRISQEPLAAEQLRELQALFHAEKEATPDHLHIATRWAQVVRSYGGSGAGKSVEILESALNTYIDAHGVALSNDSQNAFDQLISYFESDKTFARGEKKIFDALESDVNTAMADWLVERKYRLYMNAISSKTGRVSLGEGVELYQNVTRMLIAALATERNDHRYRLCNQLIDIYQAAHHQAEIASAKKDVVAFGEGAFNEMIAFDTQNYQSLVQQLSRCIHDIAGDLPALAFLIGRYEREPESFRASGNGGWQQYGYYIADYRADAKDIGNLEPRLLKIVLTELRRDLDTQRSNRQSIYHINNSDFWKEKRGDFQQLAEKIAKEQKKSIVALRYIANYLFHGLDAYQPGIDILVNAHKRGIQDEAGIGMLAGFFEHQKRYGEAVPYLREIVKMNPTNINYRRRLVTALGLSDQREESIAALDAAISYFKEHKLWSEQTINPLAQACHDAKLWKRGVMLFDELIPLHQRTQPNRGIGDGTLSHYYNMLSTCHSQLGNTSLAVDAAAGAIISWGSSNQNRANALQSLKNVLANAKDLPDYVEELDKSVAESGLENPIVRKALGQLYSDRKEYKQALHHLRLAAESQPGDLETQQALVAVYDALGDSKGAINQLLESIALSPRNIALLQDLGARYEKLGSKGQAERARTNLVEALPNESEGHAMLAEIRETQKRWDEAAEHWAMVAEIRALEPMGLQRLAKVQLQLKDYTAATETLEKLLSTEWPSRFGNVHSDARRTLSEVEKASQTK